MDKKIRLLVACHKACEVPSDPVYLPVHVGAAGKDDIGFQRDDDGEGISEKNPLYCELTGLYWAWKNLDYDYLGLVHYRRYFTLKNKKYQKEHGKMNSVLTTEETEKLLADHKVIVPKRRKYYIESCYSHYAHTFDGKQFDLAREIIEEKYPAFLDDFDRFMKQDTCWLFNMFIMNRQLTDQYLHWLFDILTELEKRYDTAGMTDFEKRYVGRVSERLFNVWLIHQIRTGYIARKDVFEVPYLYMGEIDWKRKVISFVKAKFLHQKYDKSF